MKKKILLLVFFIFLGLYLVNFFSQNKDRVLVSAQGVTITPACTTKTQGDANCDGAVDDNDYTLWKSIFLGETLSGVNADFNLDTLVDLVDFEIWRRNFYIALSPVTSTQTPTATKIPTPTIAACSACGLSSSSGCDKYCWKQGGKCNSDKKSCFNNPNCWQNKCKLPKD